MVQPGQLVDSNGPEKQPTYAPVYVQQISVRDFRGVANCDLELERHLTLLVGRNNAGKSRLLRALAVGLGAATPERDDLTVGGPQESTIDIVLAPATEGGEQFFDKRVVRRLGEVHAITEVPLRERFAWRTIVRPSNEGFGVRTERHVLQFDSGKQEWFAAANALGLSYEQRSLTEADLVETRRDLVEELARKSSPIRRVLDDLEIDDALRVPLETALAKLSGDIVGASASLAAITDALDSLSSRISSVGSATLEPLPLRIEEIAKGVSVHLDTGNGGLPMRLHGAGSRSLASLQVQSVLYQRRLGRDGPDLLPLPISLVEEPEAHLHPQAQFELADLLTSMEGQVIVSTHSTHLLSTIDPNALRVLKPHNREIRIVDLKATEGGAGGVLRARQPSLHFAEMEKIRRMVERPFGELLFASVIVLGDGATERALLPPLLRHVLGHDAEGVCVVDPGSMAGDYAHAIVKFGALLDIPWALFSDSDEEGVAAAKRLDSEHGDGDGARIIWVGDPDSGTSATESVLSNFDEDLCASACRALGFERGGVPELLKFMKKHKGAVGRLLASELIDRYPDKERILTEDGYWPLCIAMIIRKVSDLLALDRGTL